MLAELSYCPKDAKSDDLPPASSGFGDAHRL
jgi:hypothetical protein